MRTFSIGITSLLVQICGTVLLEGSGVSAAVEEGLLFFLGVCSQHLFGQSQPLVGLLLLARGGHHADRQSWGRRALCHILNNLCTRNWSNNNQSNRTYYLAVESIHTIRRSRYVSECSVSAQDNFYCKKDTETHQTLAEVSCLRHGRWCCYSCTAM